MKFKALLLALAVSGLGAAFGLTDTGRSDTGTNGTTTTTTTTSHDGDCRHFELKGTLVTVSSSSFTAAVLKGSDGAKALVGTTATFTVTADTRVSWSGRGTLTGPNTGDSVKVNGKQCGGSAGALTVLKVDASSAKTDKKHQDEHHTGTTTTTTTTSSSDAKHGNSHK